MSILRPSPVPVPPIIDWDNSKRYYWFGLGGTGIYAGDETEVYYRSNVTWFENQYGLKAQRGW